MISCSNNLFHQIDCSQLNTKFVIMIINLMKFYDILKNIDNVLSFEGRRDTFAIIILKIQYVALALFQFLHKP